MEVLNPKKTGMWAWIGIAGGVLLLVGVFIPWLDLFGLAYVTGLQLGIYALGSGIPLIQFFIGNIFFIFILGLVGLLLLITRRFGPALAASAVALAFCTLDVIFYWLLSSEWPIVSAGPYITFVGAILLTEGAHRLRKG